MKTSLSTSRKRGRKPKSFTCPWNNKTIDGLYRRPGTNRWRVASTGQEFREADEREAVRRFLAIESANAGRQTVELSAPLAEVLPGLALPSTETTAEDLAEAAVRVAVATRDMPGRVRADLRVAPADWQALLLAHEPLIWAWVRRQLHVRPEYVAQATGCPGLVNYAKEAAPPSAPIKIMSLADLYDDRSGTGPSARRRVRRSLKGFAKVTGYQTLRDVLTEGVLKYRAHMEKTYPNPETRSNQYAALSAAITLAESEGKDANQIRPVREAFAVLRVKRNEERVTADPKPIRVGDYRKLLAGADPQMRALLLLALNCCQYLSEVLSVEWNEVDLDGRTYQSRREKTGVRRAAVLWPETVEALRALPRRGGSPFVFCSSHGTRFNTNSYRNKFRRLVKASGVNVEFNQIRDGAYSSSCGAGVDFAACQLLAGHRLPGEADKYVARVPKKTAPACAAVYEEYAPFPTSTSAIKIGRPRKAAAVAA